MNKLEDVLKSLSLSDTKKVYIPDTNVLINEAFSPHILSGNSLPDPEVNARFLDIIQKTRKQYDPSPNDVIIYEIIDREIDNLKHDPRKSDIALDLNAAVNSLIGIKKNGSFKFVNDAYSYSSLDNQAKIHFISHDEDHFKRLNLFEGNNDDRIIRFIFELKKRYQDKDQNKDKDKDFIFVTNDGSATDRALKLGISVQPFEFISVSDPNQLYTGISKISLTSNKYDKLFYSPSVKTPDIVKKSCRHPKSNQFLEVEVGDEKRFLKFTDNCEYIKSLDSYDSFIRFLEKPDLARITNLLASKFTKEDKERDSKKKIDTLLRPTSKSQLRKELKKANKQHDYKRADEFERRIRSLDTNTPENEDSVYEPTLTKFRPINEQKALVDLYSNNKIFIRSVIGAAGTGKTFWAIATGIHLFCNGTIDKIRCIKPLVGTDEGVGYLPGSIEEKMKPWSTSFKDDILEFFGYYDTRDLKEQNLIYNFAEKLNKAGIIQDDILTHMSGRTLRNEYVILDESEFIKRKHVELMIGRVGKGSYLNFLGDPKQAQLGHKLYIDERSCGAALIPDRLQGERLFGHITLPKDCVQRSEAAKLAEKFYK